MSRYKCMKSRSFLGWLGGILTGLPLWGWISDLLGGGSHAWAQTAPFKKGNRASIVAAKVQGLAAGVPTHFPEARAWIVAAADGKLDVFDHQCTHKGCRFDWNASKGIFECPCHGSSFDTTGKVKGGPAPAPLTRLKVEKAVNGDLQLLD